MKRKLAFVFHSAGALALSACTLSPTDGASIDAGTVTFSGLTPLSNSPIDVRIQDTRDGTWLPLDVVSSGTTSSYSDCAQNGSTPLYSWSSDAPLFKYFDVNSGFFPWEYYTGLSSTQNTVTMKAVEFTSNGTYDLANFGPNFASCAAQHPCAQDLVQNCSINRPLSLKVPCGAPGGPCCMSLESQVGDPASNTPVSCPAAGNPFTGTYGTGALCDAVGICRKGMWPPLSDWSGEFDNPSGGLKYDYANEFQGVAGGTYDGNWWYLTNGDASKGVTPNIWKVPMNANWNQNFSGVYQHTQAQPNNLHCGHLGDLDLVTSPFDSKLYVPAEQCSDGINRLLRYDPNLNPIDSFPIYAGSNHTAVGHAAAVAVSLVNAQEEIYMMGEDPATVIHVYRLSGSPLALNWIRDVQIDIAAQPTGIQTPQGMAFDVSGQKLYIIGSDPYQTEDSPFGITFLFGFQMSPNHAHAMVGLLDKVNLLDKTCPQETEGLAVVDTDALGYGLGQIHTFVYEDNSVPTCTSRLSVWFKHYRLNGDSRW